jgi:CheY-like chemotaxis protein
MLNSARILIVEDEPLIAMDLAHVIEEAEGVVAASVRSIKAALEQVDGGHFHAVLLDVRLPDGLSFDIAERLDTDGIPFVFCTADNDDTGQFSRWPHAPILQKPHQPGAIVRTLRDLLNKRTN